MLIINNKALKVGNKWLNPGGSPGPDPYNPLNLPPNTMRVRTSDGEPPVKDGDTSYETATLVTGTTDVYDVYKSGTDFRLLLWKSSNVIEILGANTSNVNGMYMLFDYCTSLTNVALFDTSKVTNMQYMFYGCSSLSSIPLYDTSNALDMSAMFYNCTSLTSIPLFNTSKVNDMTQMFKNCTNVESGALALYQQVSARNPTHYQTFSNCGSNTQTGAAELAQIPSDWK